MAPFPTVVDGASPGRVGGREQALAGQHPVGRAGVREQAIDVVIWLFLKLLG